VPERLDHVVLPAESAVLLAKKESVHAGYDRGRLQCSMDGFIPRKEARLEPV
jgi:hypothetical protein